MYSVLFSDLALKQLRKLPKEVQQRIVSTLERIRIRPEVYVTRLVGQEGFKLRVGDYRIIMDIQHNNLLILVIKVGHRRNIYDF